MAIYLSNRQKALPIKTATLRRRLAKLLRALDLAEAEVSVTMVDDREMRRINREYRRVDAPTNVLAFAMEDGAAPPGGPRVLGDIVLSAETIQREAPPLGYTEGELFHFYLVHGLLHLIGYDHELGREEAARQEAETERLWGMINHTLSGERPAPAKRTFVPRGVCSKRIDFEMDGELVRNIRFEGGCNGNLKGLASLAEGRRAAEIIEALSGIKCGRKATSCPDQLARALKRRTKARNIDPAG